MMALGSIGVAIALAQPAGSGERWTVLGGVPGGHSDYLDRQSIVRDGSTVRLWTRRDYASGKRTYWSEIELDCAADRVAILAWVEDEGGIVSHNVERPHRAASPIAPGSPEARIRALVCR